MSPYEVIDKYYRPGSKLRDILVRHSERVAEKALAVAERAAHLNPDRRFIREAALLHDIGIFLTRKPEIACRGTRRYILHGLLGRRILEKEGLPAHARVCERHVGAGITAKEAREHGFPVPWRDMAPVSLEEKIICYADKFFSKSPGKNDREEKMDDIVKELKGHGPGKAERFLEWAQIFE
ncbi:conserved hypothetical protein [Candidatus Desulfarcum epimagneticum]|uniref:HD domain-containing protein n=1 Tax=uncultured Desulfobacteraceae bacterium TaxID=218296 RepID=A0A484HEK4_9BACT|nr:conserved hypothetical protein [uncultured Desulfobacteraceae bacterium]